MGRIIKSRILFFVLGVVLTCGIVYAADILINADKVTYEETTVKDALDDILIDLRDYCPEGYTCSNLYNLVLDKSDSHITKIYYSINNGASYSNVESTTTIQIPYGTKVRYYAEAESGYTVEKNSTTNYIEEEMTKSGLEYKPTSIAIEYTVSSSTSGGCTNIQVCVNGECTTGLNPSKTGTKGQSYTISCISYSGYSSCSSTSGTIGTSNISWNSFSCITTTTTTTTKAAPTCTNYTTASCALQWYNYKCSTQASECDTCGSGVCTCFYSSSVRVGSVDSDGSVTCRYG